MFLGHNIIIIVNVILCPSNSYRPHIVCPTLLNSNNPTHALCFDQRSTSANWFWSKMYWYSNCRWPTCTRTLTEPGVGTHLLTFCIKHLGTTFFAMSSQLRRLSRSFSPSYIKTLGEGPIIVKLEPSTSQSNGSEC